MRQMMRDYTYKKYSSEDAYGQPALTDGGSVKMAISVLNEQTTDNVLYKDAQYIGITHDAIDDKCVITTAMEKIEVALCGAGAVQAGIYGRGVPNAICDKRR